MAENKFDARNTRTGEISDELKSVLESQNGLVCSVALINLDASDPEEMASGMVSVFDKDAQVDAINIPNNLGQYMMISEIAPRKGGYTDAYFQTKEMKQKLDDNVPQFNENPPLYGNRHRVTNNDTNAWGPELGQEDGMAGVYKVMEPNGRDARYYLAVRSSIPEVTH